MAASGPPLHKWVGLQLEEKERPAQRLENRAHLVSCPLSCSVFFLFHL